MRGIYRSFKRVENETIRRIDAQRKSLNSSASKLAKQHRQERNIALFALAKEGVLRIPAPQFVKWEDRSPTTSPSFVKWVDKS